MIKISNRWAVASAIGVVTSLSVVLFGFVSPSVVRQGAVPSGQLFCGGVAVTLTGTEEGDVIHGLPGNDLIFGLSGDDKICGERRRR